jgi:hypothetical protein
VHRDFPKALQNREECNAWNGGPERVVKGSMDNVYHNNDGFTNGQRKKHQIKEVRKGENAIENTNK